MDAAGQLHGSCMDAAWMLHGSCMATAGQLHGCCMWQPHGSCVDAAWMLHEGCMASHQDFIVATKVQHGRPFLTLDSKESFGIAKITKGFRAWRV